MVWIFKHKHYLVDDFKLWGFLPWKVKISLELTVALCASLYLISSGYLLSSFSRNLGSIAVIFTNRDLNSLVVSRSNYSQFSSNETKGDTWNWASLKIVLTGLKYYSNSQLNTNKSLDIDATVEKFLCEWNN